MRITGKNKIKEKKYFFTCVWVTSNQLPNNGKSPQWQQQQQVTQDG